MNFVAGSSCARCGVLYFGDECYSCDLVTVPVHFRCSLFSIAEQGLLGFQIDCLRSGVGSFRVLLSPIQARRLAADLLVYAERVNT